MPFMEDRAALVRHLHSAVYVVMATSVLVILFAGITGARGPWLTVALVLVSIEVVVFVGNGFSCPLTQLARKYGGERGYAFDAWLPERVTKYTFRLFTTLLGVGLTLLAIRAVLG